MLAASTDSGVARWLNHLSGPWLYAVVVVLTFAETGTLLFLVPGEIGLLVAGAAAGVGKLNLFAMVVLACMAALLGDATGFAIGRRFGPRLRDTWLGRKLGADSWHRADDLVRRRRGLIVLVGRWIGFLRAVMPATAGMTGMRYRREFLPWDIAGAVSWASICVIGGYKLGDNWESLAHKFGTVGLALAAVFVVLGGVAFVWQHRRSRRVV
jgi:membrane protein DedA with SNARE-associated domain